MLSSGSPPRVRGKVACRCRSFRDTRDHPRVCGEKSARVNQRVTVVGSPPRVRGKDNGAASDAAHRGITPACAGKSHALAPLRIVSGDHPRVCGEKPNCFFWLATHWGSPPRVRGKDRGALLGDEHGRITPACAGKSCSRSRNRRTEKDHPRVCGEKMIAPRIMSSDTGSPPRVRGKD